MAHLPVAVVSPLLPVRAGLSREPLRAVISSFSPARRLSAAKCRDTTHQISQVVSTTNGASYTIEFDLANRSNPNGPGPADFQVIWDHTVVYDNAGVTTFGPTPSSVTVTGTGSDTLVFEGYQVNSLVRIIERNRARALHARHADSRIWLRGSTAQEVLPLTTFVVKIFQPPRLPAAYLLRW